VPGSLAAAGRFARRVVKARLLAVFFGLCALGVVVGLATRPREAAIPEAELFDRMSVLSYREMPSDTTARFVVELGTGDRVFAHYDLDRRRFLPPPRGRAYTRTITGTSYPPLRMRGHVGYGFWLDVPDGSGRSLLPEQFRELYQSTLGFVKPVSILTGVLGIVSGYSVGYRLAAWHTSLASPAVRERVLATPGIGRVIAREAWRRVLLEPAVMAGEGDVTRFAAAQGGHRLYAGFLRVAVRDSDGFIPREAARLESLGRADAAWAMRAFATAVERASRDSVHLGSTDFVAIERWASLLDRHGHWAADAIPPAGEERARYLGMLAWYGIAPPGPVQDRVWVGPRMLVRVGHAEGFVADEIPATGVGCPVSWRLRLAEANSSAAAAAAAWLADHPEFPALISFGGGIARRAASWGGAVAARLATRPDPRRPAARAVGSALDSPQRLVPAVTGGEPIRDPAPLGPPPPGAADSLDRYGAAAAADTAARRASGDSAARAAAADAATSAGRRDSLPR
jgi:hypothetical protein